MALVRLSKISIAFGIHALLDKADLNIEAGARIGLIGRNGEGKSTLMNIIAGTIVPDEGEVWREPGGKMALLDQAPVFQPGATIYDAVLEGHGETGVQLASYHKLLLEPEPDLEAMGNIQHHLDKHDGWSIQQQVESILSKLDLPADRLVGELSGGWQRRVALARTLVLEPDVLLLDEPTNHIDIDNILWLQEKLLNYRGAVMLVTHDRSFLQAVSNQIVELDRGQLVCWPGDYANYLKLKAAAVEEEARHNALFDKKLAEEEVWIRQGIKARRTRNEGRVRALEKLRATRSQRRTLGGKADMKLDSGELSGKLVIEAKDMHFSYENNVIANNLSLTIMRGDRIGLIGPNGVGKSTLIQLLLKQLEPDRGSIRHGTKLQVAYFDQLREQLNPDDTIVDAVGNGSDYVTVGERQQHIMSYLSDFLFQPARARTPIRSLSGGEKNRVLLARLFSRSANFLIMDEPTNDLDIETLELLEELLMEYKGTLLLVSHDRTFLDNIVTSSLVFEGNGQIEEYVGGYSDWLRQKAAEVDASVSKQKSQGNKSEVKTPSQTKSNPKQKLSYKEKQVLEQLPAQIEVLEVQQQTLVEQTSSSDFYQNDQALVAKTLKELETVQKTLEQHYSRWDELEAKEASLSS